jgi:hypothetical protein
MRQLDEGIPQDGTLRQSLFLRKLGPGYIARAFAAARAADPDAVLLLNDYGTEDLNPKSDAQLALVADLLRQGVPIDGVGFQMHVNGAGPPAGWNVAANLARHTALGLTVEISEMDVRVAAYPGTFDERMAQQARVYHELVGACISTPACTTVTFWGFTDAHSWVDSFFGEDDPLLFDANYALKPAFHEVQAALLGLSWPLDEGPVVDPPDPENVLVNPDFEDGTRGWVVWGGALSTSADGPARGAAFLRHTGREQAWQGPVQSVLGRLEQGTRYRAEAQVRISGAAAARALLTLHIVDAAGDRYVNLAGGDVTDGAWTLLSNEVVLDVEAPVTTLDFYVEGPPPGVELWVDAVRLVPSP